MVHVSAGRVCSEHLVTRKAGEALSTQLSWTVSKASCPRNKCLWNYVVPAVVASLSRLQIHKRMVSERASGKNTLGLFQGAQRRSSKAMERSIFHSTKSSRARGKQIRAKWLKSEHCLLRLESSWEASVYIGALTSTHTLTNKMPTYLGEQSPYGESAHKHTQLSAFPPGLEESGLVSVLSGTIPGMTLLLLSSLPVSPPVWRPSCTVVLFSLL